MNIPQDFQKYYKKWKFFKMKITKNKMIKTRRMIKIIPLMMIKKGAFCHPSCPPTAGAELKTSRANSPLRNPPFKRSHTMKILSFLLSLLFFWRKEKSVVPVVRLSGVISSAPSLRRGLSLESIEPQLKKAFSVRSAKAVALIINSPGGSPVQSALKVRVVRAN